jgi:hypothetical protein
LLQEASSLRFVVLILSFILPPTALESLQLLLQDFLALFNRFFLSSTARWSSSASFYFTVTAYSSVQMRVLLAERTPFLTSVSAHKAFVSGNYKSQEALLAEVSLSQNSASFRCCLASSSSFSPKSFLKLSTSDSKLLCCKSSHSKSLT